MSDCPIPERMEVSQGEFLPLTFRSPSEADAFIEEHCAGGPSDYTMHPIDDGEPGIRVRRRGSKVTPTGTDDLSIPAPDNVVCRHDQRTGDFVLIWDAVDGAHHYEIERYIGADDRWTHIKTAVCICGATISASPPFRVRAVRGGLESASSDWTIARVGTSIEPDDSMPDADPPDNVDLGDDVERGKGEFLVQAKIKMDGSSIPDLRSSTNDGATQAREAMLNYLRQNVERHFDVEVWTLCEVPPRG